MGGALRLFLSYARNDQAKIQFLVSGLTWAGHDVWVDQQLRGGADWWETILEQIRGADAFLPAVSRNLLASVACTREREYALALGKPMLPVLIDPMQSHFMTPDLATRQVIDFTAEDAPAAFRLAGAITNLPPPPALPRVLPQPPDIPLSYLTDLSRLVHAGSLTLEEQLSIVARLREALEDDEDREVALELAHALRRRDDLYAAVERRLNEILQLPAPTPMAAGTSTTPQAAPATGTGGSSPRLMTEAEIHSSRFNKPLVAEGYDEKEVDTFLDTAAAALGDRRAALDTHGYPGTTVHVGLLAKDVNAAAFRTRKTGSRYDMSQVDDFLDRIEACFAELDIELTRRGLVVTKRSTPAQD
jgi:DivIVA domain-containing protein